CPTISLATCEHVIRFAFCRHRRCFVLQPLLAVSTVSSGRIEFVSRAYAARQFYGLSVRFQLLSTTRRQVAVTFNSWREAPPQRDFHPPMHALSQAHERGVYAASSGEISGAPDFSKILGMSNGEAA